MAITIFLYGISPASPHTWPYFVLRTPKIHVRCNSFGNYVIYAEEKVGLVEAMKSFVETDIGEKYLESEDKWHEFIRDEENKNTGHCCGQ